MKVSSGIFRHKTIGMVDKLPYISAYNECSLFMAFCLFEKRNGFNIPKPSYNNYERTEKKCF